jgi:hypothetical protein
MGESHSASGVAYGDDKELNLCALSLVSAQSGIKTLAGYMAAPPCFWYTLCASRVSGRIKSMGAPP